MTEERGRILRQAIEVINGERLDVHGKPEDSFKTISAYWTAYLKAEGLLPEDKELTPLHSMIMQTLFKIARMSGQSPHIDNYIDGAGYLGIAGDMAMKSFLPDTDKLVTILESSAQGSDDNEGVSDEVKKTLMFSNSLDD